MRLAIEGAGGREPFVLTGERITVEGTVTPFVAGQQITVHFYRDGRIVKSTTVPVRPLAHHRAGRFKASYASPRGGAVRVVAVHSPTSQMGLFAAGIGLLKVISPNLSSGARGEVVRLLQRRLGALHYAVPQSGYFDEATADAVIAYRKMTSLPLVPYTDATMFRSLRRNDGAFRVRFPRDGRHIEADLQHQVLVEVEPHGRVANIYMMSSGKPSTPTVLGRFAVYRKDPGVNSELMYDSNYFISGYAIHGYPEVPTYAASHGCLRVPNLDAPALFAWIRIGTIVDVYN
jgi:peptidoglycan hydrolase-like protein with peptidoglycan-binding domain